MKLYLLLADTVWEQLLKLFLLETGKTDFSQFEVKQQGFLSSFTFFISSVRQFYYEQGDQMTEKGSSWG